MKAKRIALFGTAIGVAAWSAGIVVTRQSSPVNVVAVALRPTTVAAPAVAAPAAPALAAPAEPALPRRAQLVAEPGDDSFAARQWLPPPPPPPPPSKIVQAPPPPPSPAPPPPPTLPYKLVGLMDAGAGAKPQVFLALQDRLLVASPGDVLDGGFRLDAVNARELSFTHLASNVTLRMSVTGAPS